jgi:hypothetical protein
VAGWGPRSDEIKCSALHRPARSAPGADTWSAAWGWDAGGWGRGGVCWVPWISTPVGTGWRLLELAVVPGGVRGPRFGGKDRDGVASRLHGV